MVSLYKLLLKTLDRKMKIKFIILVMFTGLLAFLEATVVGSVLPFMNIIQAPETFINGQYGEITKLYFGAASAKTLIICAGIGIITLFITKNVLSVYQLKMMNKYIQGFYSILSNKLLTSYLYKPYTFYLTANSSILTKNVITETMNVSAQMLSPVLNIFSESLILLLILMVLIVYNFKIAIISLAATFIVLSVIYVFTNKVNKKLGQKREYSSGQITKLAYESFSGIKEIKVSGTESYFIEMFSKNTQENADATSTHNTIQAMPKLFLETIIITTIIGCIIYFSINNAASEYLISTMVLYLAAAYRVMPSINRISSAFMRLHFSIAGLEMINKEICSLEYAEIGSNSKVDKLTFNDRICIDQVSYKYGDNEYDVLQDINLTIDKGNVVAIIGESGAGKSTLLNILIGLLEVDRGEITLDDIRIDHNNIRNWQSTIAYVPQSVFIADDTLIQNIAFGIDNMEIDRLKIERILKTVQLKEFVDGIPEGTEVRLGDKGNRLSGGQVQRIGIARALYKECPVIVLDEATSAIDVETERKILSGIKKYHGDVTLLIVTHRHTIFEFCDYIYEVLNGKAVKRDIDEVMLTNNEE